MQDIVKEIAVLREQNKAFALCIVTDSQGSTPRKAGSKMVVFSDGSSMGTVGGGAIEMQVLSDAIEALRNNTIITKQYQLACDLSMQCGGSMTVYIEAFLKVPDLIIFGAGHIGRELGPLAYKLGFRITYVDQRENIFNSFNSADAVCVNSDIIDFAEKLDSNLNTYIVVATYEHALDEALAGILSKKDFAYLGVIGSKRKVAAIKQNLSEEKGIDIERINKIDMPIGIPFKADTPIEIALSIAAKLTDVKNTPAS